jgi:hypothetical protein
MAGTVTQTHERVTKNYYIITFSCTSHTDGSIPDTDTDDANTKILKGKQLIAVITRPGTVAPDAADVLIKTEGARDLLGGKGVNLIHDTAEQSCTPYNTFTSCWEYPIIYGPLTLDVDNQVTNGATYTVELHVKGD